MTFIFSGVIISFSLLVLATGFFFHHRSIMKVLQDTMLNNEKTEFVTHFFYSDLDTFSKITEDEIFQVIDSRDQIVARVENKGPFTLELHPTSLAKARQGRDDVITANAPDGQWYSVLYFPLTKEYVGRIAMNLGNLQKYDQTFLVLVLLSLPVFILIAYQVSRYLVNLAMKPIGEAFGFQENFSANVAHELLTPLTTLKGNLEISVRKEREAKDYQDFIRTALAETDRIITLLQDLHLLASAEFKPMELQKSRVDLLATFREAWQHVLPEFQRAGLHVTDPPPGEAHAYCDQILIRRVFDNLLENVLKYTTGERIVTCNFQRDGTYGVFTVQNSSAPLAPNELAQLGEPFFRAANATSQQTRGKGLGLNLVRYIVQSHAGKLRISLTKGNIFTVTVKIPLAT